MQLPCVPALLFTAACPPATSGSAGGVRSAALLRRVSRLTVRFISDQPFRLSSRTPLLVFSKATSSTASAAPQCSSHTWVFHSLSAMPSILGATRRVSGSTPRLATLLLAASTRYRSEITRASATPARALELLMRIAVLRLVPAHVAPQQACPTVPQPALQPALLSG